MSCYPGVQTPPTLDDAFGVAHHAVWAVLAHEDPPHIAERTAAALTQCAVCCLDSLGCVCADAMQRRAIYTQWIE